MVLYRQLTTCSGFRRRRRQACCGRVVRFSNHRVTEDTEKAEEGRGGRGNRLLCSLLLFLCVLCDSVVSKSNGPAISDNLAVFTGRPPDRELPFCAGDG